MSYQVKIPETKYILELAQVNEDWYLQVKIDDSIEEQLQVVRFTSSHLEENIDKILFNVGFSLNPVQLKIVTDNMREHAAFLFGDKKAAPVTENEKMADWASPSRVAAITSSPPAAEPIRAPTTTPTTQYQRPEPTHPTPSRPTPTSSTIESKSPPTNIIELVQSHEKLQSKVEQLETRITLLERIIRDLR
ncbi:MAG: hypothetical protein ACXAD7_06290 [Candidatus Kariarchaeaceae archaeon]